MSLTLKHTSDGIWSRFTTMLNGAWFARARLAPFKRVGGAIGLFKNNKNKTLRRLETAGNQQVSEMWTRPVLCRLCECPASDGGVRVDQLDAAKLSKWWLCKIGTEFQPEESEIEEIICNFCIWDAR
jgi:hypothetical protein